MKALEEEQNLKKTVESVVFVKKSQLSNDAEDSSSESGGPFDEALPEIEARFCDKNVLIRIHCEKNKGVVEKTINEIEKLHLKVINSSAMTFGSCALDITIIAQVISVPILWAETRSSHYQLTKKEMKVIELSSICDCDILTSKLNNGTLLSHCRVDTLPMVFFYIYI